MQTPTQPCYVHSVETWWVYLVHNRWLSTLHAL